MQSWLRGAVALVLALAAGCGGAETADTTRPAALDGAKFENRSPGGQLNYLGDQLPARCEMEAERFPELAAMEDGTPRVTVTGHFSVQGGSLAATARWTDARTKRSGAVEVKRPFGTDPSALAHIQRELALRLLLDVVPDAWILHVRLGNALRHQSLLGKAREEYRRAATAKLTGGDAERTARALFLVALASEELSEPAVAAKEYRAALAADPAHHEARVNLALVLQQLGDGDGARKMLLEARKQRPEDASVRLALGEIEERAGRPDAAIRLYREAVRLDPREVLARFSLATALFRRQRYPEAYQEFSTVRKIHSGHRLALLSMGVCASRMNDAERARRHLADFISEARRDPSLQESVDDARAELAKLPPR
jgi:tetratricopeptide (TPR) repeat protein